MIQDSAELLICICEIRRWSKINACTAKPPVASRIATRTAAFKYDAYLHKVQFDAIDAQTLYLSSTPLSQRRMSTQSNVATLEILRIWFLRVLHFFAILYYMGIVRWPSKRDYWSGDPMLSDHQAVRGMNRLMFEFIWRYIHFLGASNDEPSGSSSQAVPQSSNSDQRRNTDDDVDGILAIPATIRVGISGTNSRFLLTFPQPWPWLLFLHTMLPSHWNRLK